MVIKIIIMLATIFMYNIVEAQSYDMDTTEQELGFIFGEPPVFDDTDFYKDGIKLREFIQESIIYPQTAIDNSIEGKVYVHFIIDTSGRIYKANIERGIRDDIDNEALRIINSIKFKSPAKLSGKPIPFHLTLPVNFKLPKE